MSGRIPAYNGNGQYAFVSYSHKDSHIVYSIIQQLAGMGYNIWYDEGIPLVSDYGGVLYDRIKGCSAFILFVSRNSVQSEDVEKEAIHAISFKKNIVQVVIDEDAQLPSSVAYHLPRSRQYLPLSCEPKEFYSKLTDVLAGCKGQSTNETVSTDSDEVSSETASALKAGDELPFGHFQWVVLKAENHRALLISKQAIAVQKYSEKWLTGTSWESCSLRKWLNGKFLSTFFTVDERKRILTAVNRNHNSDGAEYSEPTQDRIFCLSKTEAEELFSSDSQRVTFPSDAAKSSLLFAPSGSCRWWLRTIGIDNSHATIVDTNGQIIARGIDVSDGRTFVRPAFYLEF